MELNKHKRIVRDGFDTVAAGYDHPALRFFPQTAAALLRALEPEPTAALLDVCAGTGAVALHAAQRLHRGCVTGVDFSPQMLERARRKAEAQGLSNVNFLLMDMEALAFEEASFDAATCSFGLFFVEDMAGALAHIGRCVRPGGKVAISSFSGESFEPFAGLFLEHVQAFGGEVPPLTWRRLADETQIRNIFSAARTVSVEVNSMSVGFALRSAQDWWDVVWNAGFRGVLAQFDEARLQALKNVHLEAVTEQLGRGNDYLTIDVLVAVAERH